MREIKYCNEGKNTTKKSLVTPLKIRENTQRYRKTCKGLTANLYAKIKERSKRNNRRNDEFTLSEFRTWFDSNNGYRLWERWKQNGYNQKERPSVDRKDVLDGYRFKNMQILTASGNRKKGDKEKLVLWGKPICQIDDNGQVVAKYPSIKKAVEITEIQQGNISSVLTKKRNKAGGFKWCYEKEIIGNQFENPELLEVNK